MGILFVVFILDTEEFFLKLRDVGIRPSSVDIEIRAAFILESAFDRVFDH